MEVVANGASVAPLHIGATALNVGVIIGLTAIVNCVKVAEAHCPALGVKVYVVVAVLFIAGDQIPVIPFVEVVGKAANGEPEQIGGTVLKVGVIKGLTVIVI